MISIIMPMYNVEKYVGDAIRSVIAQTWEDFELIVINDGSTDNSLHVAQLAIGQDSRAQLVSQPNKGLSAARNYGLEIARGNYIYFLDSDDLLAPEALNVCMDYIANLGLDFITFSGEAFSDLPDLVEKFPQYCRPDILKPMNGQDLLERHYCSGAYSSSVCLYIFSRSLIEATQLRFDVGFLHEDEGFTPLVYGQAKKSISISRQLFLRRVRPYSIMSSGRSYKNTMGWLMAAKKIESGLSHGGIDLRAGYLKTLRNIQRDLLRSAQVTARTVGMNRNFAYDLKSNFKAGALFAIEPFVVFVMYFYVLFSSTFIKKIFFCRK